MTRTRIVSIGVGLGLVLGVGSSLAATIVGTASDDVLRGSQRADRLFGKAGDDTLLGRGGDDLLVGGPGADLLVGGPGADRLRCGPGRDVARADARDRVARDCETVTGLGPPPPPQPPAAMPGTYCGVTGQGMKLCLDVERGSFGISVTGIRLDVQAICDPPRQFAFTYALVTRALIQAGGTFASDVRFPGLVVVVDGSFDVSRASATGTFRVQAEATRGGVDYACDSGTVSWSAVTPPPNPSARPGRFCGFTAQGPGLCFDVAGSPKTVAELRLVVRTECTPPATFGLSSTIPTAYAIRADGTFGFERIGTGTAAGGGTFRVTHSMRGAFDESGETASGTLRAHLEVEAADGVRYDCDSEEFAWSVRRQQ